MKAPEPTAPQAERAATPANVSPGVAALLRGANHSPKTSDAPPDSTEEPHPLVRPSGKRLLRVSLVVADVLLVALAVFLVSTRQRPLGLGGIALCTGAIITGAWLACLALWLGEPPKKL